jgi:DNA-binding PadR family transcriptional regulator
MFGWPLVPCNWSVGRVSEFLSCTHRSGVRDQRGASYVRRRSRGTVPRSRSLDNISEHDREKGVAETDPSSFLPLPQAQFHVLVALTSGERHGYAVMQDVEASSDGTVRMGPATLYGTLKKLVDQGLAEELASRPAGDDDQRRRYYRLTGLGQRVCASEADRLAGLIKIARSNLRPGLA